MSKIIPAAFDGHEVQFRDDGWFNATSASAKFGKEPSDWLRQRDTVEYVTALAGQNGNSGFLEELNSALALDGASAESQRKLLALVKSTGYVKTSRGAMGGTWLHPKLAVPFARWLDVRFAVWCDRQIDGLIQGRADWQTARTQVKQEHGHLISMLKLSRSLDGKDTQAHHCINEARVCRYAMTGRDDGEGWDRENLSRDDLTLLAQVESLETVLVIRGAPYEERKEQCRALVLKARGQLLEAA